MSGFEMMGLSVDSVDAIVLQDDKGLVLSRLDSGEMKTFVFEREKAVALSKNRSTPIGNAPIYHADGIASVSVNPPREKNAPEESESTIDIFWFDGEKYDVDRVEFTPDEEYLVYLEDAPVEYVPVKEGHYVDILKEYKKKVATTGGGSDE